MGARLAILGGAGLLLGLFVGPLQAIGAELTMAKVQAALPQLDAVARQLVESGQVPGMSIAVVYDDQTVFLKGYGVREEGKPALVDPDTVFQLASMSKPLASTVVATLVSDGTLTWDTRISDIDPGFQLYDPYATRELTLRDLFSHRSGLSPQAGNDIEGLGVPRDEILRRLRYLKPTSSFRSTYAYSNFGITEAGIAAADAAHMSWEDLAETHLYRPLGMNSTSSRYSDFIARPDHAELHIRTDGKWVPKVKRMPDGQSPAGGVSSTARDMALWLRLQLDGGTVGGNELIKSAALLATHTPVISTGPDPVSGVPTFYGLGWIVSYSPRGMVLRHSGAFSAGARTIVSMIPAEHLGIVVLCNNFPTGVPEGLADDLYDQVFDGAPSRDWVKAWTDLFDAAYGPEAAAAATKVFAQAPAAPRAALPLSAYTGTYANDYLGMVAISELNGGLSLTIGEGAVNKTYPLTHFDGDIFLFYPGEEQPTMPAPLYFVVGPDQKAAELDLDALNDDGQGVLRPTGGGF
ncbi:MAG: serine hydrolase [Devosia sp.]|nr:serine hydrolase [Devosia sp.]